MDNIQFEIKLSVSYVTISLLTFCIGKVPFRIMPSYRSSSVSDNVFLADLEEYLGI